MFGASTEKVFAKIYSSSGNRKVLRGRWPELSWDVS